jgi:hypothetical protein
MASCTSDAMVSYHTSEVSKNKRHSTLLREKGFIITKGRGMNRPSNIGAIETIVGTGEELYLWDEPYTGNNGPIENIRPDNEPIVNPKPTATVKCDTAISVSVPRANSASVTPMSHEISGRDMSARVVPKIGILPDTSTAGCAENEDCAQKDSFESLESLALSGRVESC